MCQDVGTKQGQTHLNIISLHALLCTLAHIDNFCVLRDHDKYCIQVLGKIYAILSDANKRAIYDEDGTVDEEDDTTFNQVKTETLAHNTIAPNGRHS